MRWTDNLITTEVLFKDLKIGEGFEDSDSLYIKISDDRAFDVINDVSITFGCARKVTPRYCEINFH